MADDNVRRLRRLDACSVADALDKLGLKGVVTGVPQRSGAGKLAGRAITVKLRTGTPSPGPQKHLGSTAVEAGGPDDVIVIEQRTGIDAGCWGGLLTLGAKMRGIAGVVADGPVRDIDEACGYDFPIFSTALTGFTARGRVVEDATNVAIVAWGIAVAPGDYVIADKSAIVFIAATNVAAVLEAAESIVAREAAMARALLANVPIGQVLSGAYENMLK